MNTENENIKKELLEIEANQLLNQIEKNQDIPKDYFNNLSSNVFDKISNIKVEKKRNKFSIIKIFPYALAASLVLLFAISFNNNTQKIKTEWNQFSNLDYKNYIEQNIEDFSDEEIASISNISESFLVENKFSEEELEDYLLNSEFQGEELF